MLLLDNQEVKRNWQELKDQVCGLFTKHGAEIKSAKVWEERRLAYPIKHNLRATYFLVYHEGTTDSQSAINRDLTYAEPVLRHLSVVCEEIPAEALDGADTFDPDQVRIESTYQEPSGVEGEGEEAEGEGSSEASAEATATEAKAEDAKTEGGEPKASAGGDSESEGAESTDDDQDSDKENS